MIIGWRRRQQRSFQLLATLVSIACVGVCLSWIHPLIAVVLFPICTVVSLKVTSAMFKLQPPVECTHFSCETPTDSETELFHQLDLLIENVMRDFVSKWYVIIGKNEQFPAETRYVLEDFSVALVCRGRKVKRRTLMKRLLLAYHSFIQEYLDSAQEREKVWHVAIARSNCEVKYLENAINVLLEILVPADVLCCGVARKIVVAILAKTVVLPVVELLSDPVWVNRMMIDLIQSSTDAAVDGDTSIRSMRQTQTSETSKRVDGHAASLGDTNVTSQMNRRINPNCQMDIASLETNNGKQNSESDCFWQRMMDEAPPSSSKSLRAQESNDVQQNMSPSEKNKPLRLPCSSSLEKLGDMVTNTLGELERPFEFITSNLAQYFKISNVEDGAALPSEEVCQETWHVPAESTDSACGLNVTSALGKVLSMSTGPVLSDQLLNVRADAAADRDPTGRLESTDSAFIQGQEPRRSSPELVAVTPDMFADCQTRSKLIDNISIPNTESVDEPGGCGQYVLYCIQYDAWYWYGDVDVDVDGNEDDGMIVSKGQVRRRFREFLTLQTRLEEDANMRPHLKGIKGINKWMMLPFAKIDKDAVSERRPILEKYLQSLVCKEEIATSVHLREFLAYGSDASIAFVRRPPDITNLPVPRIDRFLVKTMTGMFDKLKTALPSLPTEGSPPDTPPNPNTKSSDRLLSFLSFGSDDKESSFLTRLNFDFGHESGTLSFESQLLEHLTHSNASDRVECAYDAAAEPSLQMSDCEACPSPRLRRKLADEGQRVESSGQAFSPIVDDEVSLANIIIDLFVEIYSTCDPWISEEKLTHFLKTVSSNSIERKLNMLTEKYMCESSWVYYVKLLRQSIWPECDLHNPNCQDAALSAEEKKLIRQQFLETVRNNIHGVVPAVLGWSEYCKATKLFVDSLQHPQLLRNLVYQLLDIVLDSLVPETKNDSFTSKLLHRKTTKIDNHFHVKRWTQNTSGIFIGKACIVQVLEHGTHL